MSKKSSMTASCWAVAALVFSLAAGPGSGVAFGAPATDDREVQLSGGLFHAEGSETGNLNADVSYGYYLSPGWQVGLRQALNYNFIDDQRDVWNATTTPFLLYHFRLTDTVLPYLGGSIGAVWNDRDFTGTLGPNAGVKFFFHEQTFINLGYRYEWFFNRIDAVDNNASQGNHVFNVGIGFAWGGARKP